MQLNRGIPKARTRKLCRKRVNIIEVKKLFGGFLERQRSLTRRVSDTNHCSSMVTIKRLFISGPETFLGINFRD